MKNDLRGAGYGALLVLLLPRGRKLRIWAR